MPGIRNILSLITSQRRWRLVALAVLVTLVGLWWWNHGAKTAGKAATFAARRGPLEINVLEGGSLQALEFQEIKCEVRVGYQGTKILRIVEEGYFVTDEDVKTNKVLVELDSSDIQKQIIQQEIQYQSAVASLIDAEQNYEIQLGQNQSDVKDAEQKARFARMDFDKFLGESVTKQLCEQVGLDKLLAAATTNNVEETTRAQQAARDKSVPPATATVPGLPPAGTASAGAQPVVLSSTNAAAPAPTVAVSATKAGPAADGSDLAVDLPDADDSGLTNTIKIDFTPYADISKLGDGEAKQKLRKFEDDLQVAQKELGQAQTTLDGTRRLFEKGFVTKTDRERDEIAYENSRLKVQTAESARDLFLKYDFVRSAEEALSKYAEAVRELDKARRVAISKLAQAKAKLKSAQGQYQVQLRQRNDLNDQLDKCTLRAKKSGLVVYGSANDDMFYYGGEERVREGATVRERQAIITIPDMTHMAVKVKIHESYIKKIKKGQKARVTVDAFPDKTLTGEVTKVGVLPDSQNRWMNPDLKVYLTTIAIDGTQDWVKPGMSAKVEILVNRLDDCIYVPVQAVSPDGDRQVCYLAGLQPERREVEIGEFNDEFIQIKSGLKQGERVLLRLPDGVETQKAGLERKPPENGKDRPASPVAPLPATPASAPVQARKT
jgi:multidrug resistance efflux pump